MTDRGHIDKLARIIAGKGGDQKVSMTGATTAGGTDNATRSEHLPLPIGIAGDVLTVINDAGDLVPSWEVAAAGYTNEEAQDTIGGILTDSASIDLVYDDGANTITAAVILEWLQDTVAAILTGGTHTNITTTYQDAGGVIDLAATGGAYSDEQARDAIGAALVPGNNIDITVNDAGDTITIDVEALTSADVGLGNVDNTSDAAKPVSTATQTALNLKADDSAVVHDTGDETVAGVKTFSSDPLIPDEVYGAGWNGSLEPPTKNAVYDKIETLGGSGAPSTSKYIVQEADGGLSAEQSLGLLTTGILKNTVTAAVGVLSTAVGADLPAHTHPSTDIDATVSTTEFGYLSTVTSNIQTQINALTGGSGAPVERTRRVMQALPTAAGTVALAVGMGLPAATATASNADDADGPWINHATSTTTNNPSGIAPAGASYTTVRGDWNPEIIMTVKTPSVALANVRYMIGLVSGTGSDTDSTPALSLALFRYATDVDGTAFWRCITDSGSGTPEATTTAIAVATNTTYRFEIRIAITTVTFYIDGALVATHVTTVPAATTPMGCVVRVVNLLSTSRAVKWGRIAILHD